MPTIRARGDGHQAVVRIKQHGVIVFQESRMFTGAGSEKLARSWGAQVEARVKKDGAAARVASQKPLAGLIEDYRKARAEVRPLRRAMAHELDQLIGHVGSLRLDQLRPEQFVEFARKRRAAGAGAATVLHNLSTLRSVIAAAKPMFGLEVSAVPVAEAIAALSKTGHVAKSEARDRRVSQVEVNALCAEFVRISGNPGTLIPMAAIVRLAVAFPRRLGELTDMSWEDWEPVGVVTLRDTKHPVRPRTERVAVPPTAQDIIRALPKIDARVLPYKAESVSAAFQRAVARLKLDNLHFHDLRHEGIIRLFEAGLAIEEVATISGHQSWNMLRRYTHIKPESVLEKLR